MTDEQILRHYERQEVYQDRYNARRLERYHSDPAYREHRRAQGRKDAATYRAKRKAQRMAAAEA